MRKISILPVLTCLIWSQLSHAQALNANGSVLSGSVANEASVRFLQDHFDVWLARSQPDGTGVVDIWVDYEQQRLLESHGFKFARNEKLSATLAQIPERATPGTAAIAGFPCYRTVEETYTTLEQLAKFE